MTNFRSVNRAIAEEFLEGANDMAFEFATFLTIFLRMVNKFTSTYQKPARPRKSRPWMCLEVQIAIYCQNFWYGRHKMLPNCGFIKEWLRRSKNYVTEIVRGCKRRYFNLKKKINQWHDNP
jgi:hypothetical protein